MQVKLEHLMLLITDEISMVGFEFFQQMNEVISLIKCSVSGDWGGICVLVVGDLLQLPPVASTPVYMAPKNPRTLNDLTPNGWDKFRLHELTEGMHQKDAHLVNALHNIRVQQPDIGSPEDELLYNHELCCMPGDNNYPYHAMHVYAQNIYCDEWNEHMLGRLPGVTEICVAIDSQKDTSMNLANINISDRPCDTGNLHHTLWLKVGAKVILTTNVDVSDGLTNGTMGTVAHVVKDSAGNINVILVLFENPSVSENTCSASSYKHINASTVPILKGQATFTVRGHKSCQASCTQFPLTLAWAVTIHKCQGLTLPEIVVMSPKKGKFAGGQAYVAFSHVHELCKLHIVNYTHTQIHVSPHAEAEMDQLQADHLVCTFDNHFILKLADINLLHINICNLKWKIPDIKGDMLFNSTNTVSFNETHLSKSESLESSMLGMDENFAVFRYDRDQSGGGIALFVSRTLNATQYQIDLPIEAVAVKIQQPTPIVIVSVYRPPTTPMKLFINRFGKLLRKIGHEIVCIVSDSMRTYCYLKTNHVVGC